MIADERRRLADLVESLNAEQLRTRSLCEAWSVKEVVGHLVATVASSRVSVLLLLVRSGFNIHVANARLAALMAEHPAHELATMLRAHAENPFCPPVVGYRGQLTELQIHGQDIRRPLGIPHELRSDRLHVSLDFLVGGRALGFVPKSRPAGLRFEATDLEWSWGSGPLIRGTAEAVMLALTGRRTALADLSGAGTSALDRRIKARARNS